jgi:hypothetical protein
MFFPEFHRAFAGFILEDSGKIEIGFKSKVDRNFLKTLIGRNQQVFCLLYPER